jgi:hypothetical protein
MCSHSMPISRAVCPDCFEILKNSKLNKVWFDPKLSNKKKGRMVYYCTNHSNPIHFVVEKFYVKDSLVSIRNYVFYDVKK